MPSVDQWPHEIHEIAKGVTRFKPVTATIKAVQTRKDGTFWGWKFTQDTTKDGQYTGVVWGAPQPYDETTKSYLPYKGPKFSVGVDVRVELATRQGTTEGGEVRTYYSVRNIFEAVESAEAETPPANQSVAPKGAITDDQPLPAKYTMPLSYFREHDATERASIQAQTAYNGVVALLNGASVEKVWDQPGEVEWLKQRFGDLLDILAPGLVGPKLSAGANAARTDAEVGDAEDLPWDDSKPKQPQMATGAETKR